MRTNNEVTLTRREALQKGLMFTGAIFSLGFFGGLYSKRDDSLDLADIAAAESHTSNNPLERIAAEPAVDSVPPVDDDYEIDSFLLKQNIMDDPAEWRTFKTAFVNMLRFEDYIDARAKEEGVDPDLAKAMGMIESLWDSYAVSRKGAAGFFQFMKETAISMQGMVVNPRIDQRHDPLSGIDAGVAEIKRLEKVVKELNNGQNDQRFVLMYHNWGNRLEEQLYEAKERFGDDLALSDIMFRNINVKKYLRRNLMDDGYSARTVEKELNRRKTIDPRNRDEGYLFAFYVPKETMEYMLKVNAYMMILKEHGRTMRELLHESGRHPKAFTDEFEVYKVQEGDTLMKLARQHGVELNSLIDANPHLCSPGNLEIGDKIYVPKEPTIVASSR